MVRIQTTQGALARRGFVDARTAERLLDRWHLEGFDPADLVELVAQSADPDLALAGLDRLAEIVPELGRRLAGAPVLARQLIMVLGGSSKLSQHLIAHPGHLDLLEPELTMTPAEELRRGLLTSVEADPEAVLPVAGERTGDGLRIAYRGALLRIAARDLCAPEPIEAMDGVADELSDLADAALEAALAIARAKLGADALKTRLAVVALGKCGAQELNYVSDVDVLYVAEPALDEDGRPLISQDQAITVATRLAAEMTRICSAHTAAGTIWTVDAALRPEGRAGQLVRSLSSHRVYYQKWAKTWEFQAMLKARPSAGDLELGAEFVEMLAPLVWTAAERENFVADTQAMRKRVVAHIPAREAGRELKLGEGGLRDVEFSVQLLQLVHGRADERLRVRATLPALKVLVDNGYVGRDDGKRFALSYRFLRALEHRIQLFNLRRTHVLPDSEDDLRRLGRSLGYADPVNELLSTWRHTTQGVRRLHERLFYSPLLEVVARIPSRELRLTTGRRPGSAEGSRVRRSECRAAAHRRAQPRGHPAGGDPTAAAARDARLVRRRPESRPRTARVPPGVRGARQHSVVPPGAAGRRGDGRAAGADPRFQPVRGAAAHPGAADRADARRRRRAGAAGARRAAGRDVRRREPAGGCPGRCGGDPGHSAARAVPGGGERHPRRDRRAGCRCGALGSGVGDHRRDAVERSGRTRRHSRCRRSP